MNISFLMANILILLAFVIHTIVGDKELNKVTCEHKLTHYNNSKLDKIDF